MDCMGTIQIARQFGLLQRSQGRQSQGDLLACQGGAYKHQESNSALRRLNSLAGSELGHSLCPLRHSMLGQLSWKDEADSGLNLS